MPIPHKIHKREVKFADARDIKRLDDNDIVLENSIKNFNFRTEKRIVKTSDELMLVISTNYNDLSNRVNDTSSKIDITAQQIRTEVSQSVKSLNSRIDTNASSITQTAKEIRSEVSSSVTSLGKRIDANSSSITQTAKDIRAEVSSSVSNINGRIDSLSSGVVLKKDFASMYSQAMVDNKVITSASISTYISSFVDANGVKKLISEATISADKINFKTGDFVIRNLNNQVTFTVDSSGNVTFSGTINGESVFRYPNGDGIRLTDSGLQRWNASANSWVPMYAGRYAKYVSTNSVTLNKDDDFIISFYPNTYIYLPTGCSSGKVITIKTIGHTVNIRPQSGYTLFTDHQIGPSGDGQDLNDYDRVELVLYGTTWYWNYMSI